MTLNRSGLPLVAVMLAVVSLRAQAPQLAPRGEQERPLFAPESSAARGDAARREPAEPPSQTLRDSQTDVVFDLPAGWNLMRRDGEISTFHLDARSAPRKAKMRAVAGLAFNPFPLSTFSGALLYLSSTPHSSATKCAAQTKDKPEKPLGGTTVGDLRFNRGLDEHGRICTDARDVTYTALRHGSCVRFDLVVNTFCGGEVSGVQNITDTELADVFKRLEAILGTVRFVPN